MSAVTRTIRMHSAALDARNNCYIWSIRVGCTSMMGPVGIEALRTRGVAKVRGVWLAIVVDNKDGDGNPGYRVKLKLPWLDEEESTFWARIAVPMAGPERG